MTQETQDRGEGGELDVVTSDLGGDPACWMHRVCPECGRFASEPGDRCAECGHELVT